jgi:hypothetical protein
MLPESLNSMIDDDLTEAFPQRNKHQ